jgi:hypothetical protein
VTASSLPAAILNFWKYNVSDNVVYSSNYFIDLGNIKTDTEFIQFRPFSAELHALQVFGRHPEFQVLVEVWQCSTSSTVVADHENIEITFRFMFDWSFLAKGI